MSKLTETMAIRLTLDEVQVIEAISVDLNIKKSQALRKVIKAGLSQRSEINQKMIIEMLMILRSFVKTDEKYQEILATMDKFKELQGIGVDNG